MLASFPARYGPIPGSSVKAPPSANRLAVSRGQRMARREARRCRCRLPFSFPRQAFCDRAIVYSENLLHPDGLVKLGTRAFHLRSISLDLITRSKNILP